MNAHFRQGFRDATGALGTAWPVAALTVSVFVLALAGALEGQATSLASGARAVQLRLLHGVAFGLIVPLFAFGVSGRLGRLPELMTASWGRYGGKRRGYALGRQVPAVLLTALAGALAGSLALGLGSATSAPGFTLPISAENLLAVVWVGVLAGLAYVGCLGLAQALGGDLGRLLFLVGDWLLGSGTSLFALPWPRSHLRVLLGGEGALALAPLDAALCLFAIGSISTLLGLRRVPD